jgi:uncharacterized protein (DUF3820 family)
MTGAQRRSELISKKQRAGLTPAERDEFDALNSQTPEQLKQKHPSDISDGVMAAVIRARKTFGRKAAKEIIAAVGVKIEGATGQPEFLEAFWDELVEFVELHAPVVPRLPHVLPMTDREANEFATDFMPFGKFKGEQIRTLPLKYLDGIQGLQATFSGRLARFLANEKVAEQLRIEMEKHD